MTQTWLSRQAEFRAKRIERKWRSIAQRLPHSADGKVLLHIGCGDIDAPGFINIDARSKQHVHIVTTSLFKLDMIPSGTADLIYMSHVLEHVGHRHTVETLREMHRVLKGNGVLRISVPDFDKIVSIYLENNRDLACVEGALMGGQDYPFNFHYSTFNQTNLAAKLVDTGFLFVRNWDPEKVEHHNFDDWASTGLNIRGIAYPISLNIEAVK